MSLDSPTVGHFDQSGMQETCYYVDLRPGEYPFRLDARELTLGSGLVPVVKIREYGPAGPYWYEIIEVSCGMGEAHCTLTAAQEAGQHWMERRKRGRLDPCGSIMVNGLRWDTSGGKAVQDGGFLQDFRAEFTLDVKAYPTRHAPGSAACLPANSSES